MLCVGGRLLCCGLWLFVVCRLLRVSCCSLSFNRLLLFRWPHCALLVAMPVLFVATVVYGVCCLLCVAFCSLLLMLIVVCGLLLGVVCCCVLLVVGERCLRLLIFGCRLFCVFFFSFWFLV